ncbi:MAG: tail fiber domain-containing protein, partial [Fusobacteriaceae bacterium]
ATASTVVLRDGSADITTRYFKSNVANVSTISGAMAFRTAASSGIEFCSSPEAIRTWLGASASGGDATYVKKAGDTMSGNLLFSNNMGAFMGMQGLVGNNDYWRVGGGATASDAGYLEIATADNGTEPIYVRQYTGVFTSLTRTATLLDASGNTSFPNTVTAQILSSTRSGRTSTISSENASYTHYKTTADSGHWFDKDIRVQGNIYCGPSYNQLVWSTNNLAFGTGATNMATGNHTHTAAQVGLGNVANFGYSNAIGDNSVERYATTNMVAQVRAEKVSKGGDTMTGTLTTPKIIDNATNFGKDVSPLITIATGGWSKPIGFTSMITNTSVGRPSTSDSHGYWTVLSKRDTAGGYSGFFTGYSTRDIFYGNGGTSSVNPTWAKIFTSENKPNSTDVGLGNVGNYSAVNKAGDTMTGNLHINAELRVNSRAIIDARGFGGVGQVPAISFAIGDNDTGFNWASDGVIDYWANNVRRYSMLDVYHNGRKPSAADVGAVSKSGDTMTGMLTINNNSPTILLRDTDNMSAFLHCNSNLLYVLRSPGNNGDSWDNGPNGRHPMTLSLADGSVTFSGNVTAYSDKRLKKNIRPISDPLNKINELNGIIYETIETNNTKSGVIAQEVAKVMPSLVTEDKDGYLSVAYGNMVGLLIEGIKELKREIDDLKSQLNKDGKEKKI